MRNINVTLLALAIAMVATQGALGVETPLTDYSRAVMLENPMYYWTFNEAGATDVANDVMRYEPEGQMLAVGDATRDASYSTELGTAASFNDNAAFWAGLINRGMLARCLCHRILDASRPGRARWLHRRLPRYSHRWRLAWYHFELQRWLHRTLVRWSTNRHCVANECQ